MSNVIIFPLTNGYNSIIDSDDFAKVSEYKWYGRKGKNGTIYATSTMHKNLHMHRFILGVTDRKMFVDHIDHNGLNNSKSNLRKVNNSQNMRNMRPCKNTSSKFKGVYWNKTKKLWTTQITVNKNKKHIGHFINEIDAAKRYNEMAKKLHGEFAFLNPV